MCVGARWLELDDLKPSVCSWSNDTPRVPPSEVHVVVFEKISTDPRDDQISLQDNKPGNVINSKNGALTSPTEMSRNKEIAFLKADVCKEESISSHMDKLTVKDVEETQAASEAKDPIVESNLIAWDLKHKVVGNECSSPASTSGNIPARYPLKDCANTTDKTVTTPHIVPRTRTSLQPEITPVVPRNTPSPLSSSFSSTSLDKSLFKVTLKRHSCSRTIKPLLNNKRRALSSQFQPYVPKKQRLESQVLQNKSNILDFDNNSDSGYSSPSSVSSCGSASSTMSTETEQKMSVADDVEKMEIDDSNHENFAEELEKLLPDCLLDDCRKRIPVDDDDEHLIHNEKMKLESVSQEQDDFIRNLLFSD